MMIGTLAGSATLGLLIPPSIILIVYGVATEQSIARLFIAGILPGLLLVGLFIGYVAIWSLLHRQGTIPADDVQRYPWARKLRRSRRLIPMVLLIGGVIGSIYAGIASPTDAAAVGVLLSLVLSRLSGTLNRRTFLDGADGGDQDLLHDRLHPGRRRLPDGGHGLYRHSANARRLDRHPADCRPMPCSAH